MADEFEPFDVSKKAHIDDVLTPDLDDAVLRIARMRKAQVVKCKSAARNIVTNSVKYYSTVTVECEDMEPQAVKRLHTYGTVDLSVIHNTSAFSKEMSSCLSEMRDLKKSKQLTTASRGQNDDRKQVYRGRFSRIKSSHLVPGCH